MKNIKYLLAFFLVSVGCEKLLEKEPLDMFSDAVLWNDENLVNSYLADLYVRTDLSSIISKTLEGHQFAMIASMGGEGRSFGAHHSSYQASTNVITNAGVHGHLDYWKYNNMRDANFFIEKIQNSTINQDIVNQRIAEVRFLRAYMYFQKVIRYGGVPILTRVQSYDDPVEEIFVPRNSEKEVYDFIISELDELTQILPSEYDLSMDKGRPSKWAAYALISRAALYAASIAKYGEVQMNGLLGFPASDVEFYANISYNASKAIIDNGIHFLYEAYDDPAYNFQNLFLDESGDNKEVIMAEVYNYARNLAHPFTLRAMPHDFSGTWASMKYLYDFVERFEFADGSPGNSITRTQLVAQEWTPEELFKNRDPRFNATVFYPESEWQGGKVLFHRATIRNGVTYTSGISEDGWPYAAHARNHARTGLMVRKRCREDMTPTDTFTDDTDIQIFRLGEIFLNLAEAAYYLGYTGEALEVLNRIRQRAGMPPKSVINEEILQNERLVELSWENHSYWDLRRWRIAEQVLNGVRKQGLRYIYNYDTKKYIITLINAEGVARTFHERNYYLPLGVSRTAENPNFVENPDY